MVKRLEYVDTAKGICILLVMLGHCAYGTDSRHNLFLITWIYSFHTTTFFVITGILMEHILEYRRPMKQILVSCAKRLLIPYYIFQLIYSIWYCLMNGFHNFKWLITDIILLVGWSYASWFLISLFVAKVITTLIRKISKKQIVANVSLLVLFLLALILCKSNFDPPMSWLYKQGIRTLIGVGFILFGSVLYRYEDYLRRIIILVVSLCMSLMTAYMNGLVSTFNLSIGNPLLYTLSAISGAIFVLSLSIHVRNKLLTFFGNESVTALGTHQIILWSFTMRSILLWFVITPLTAIIMLVVSSFKRNKTH